MTVWAIYAAEAGAYAFGDNVVACFIAAAGLMVASVLFQMRTSTPLLDLKLFRKPTFSGGSIAACGISAGIFSMLLYLTLYLQNVLRYTALQTGLRLLVLSGAILLVSGIAVRLSSHVPARWPIGSGLALTGVHMFLMCGLDTSTAWTHLIPGVHRGGRRRRHGQPAVGLHGCRGSATPAGGMASGVNSTFRQVGIATGMCAARNPLRLSSEERGHECHDGNCRRRAWRVAGRSHSVRSTADRLPKFPKAQIPVVEHIAATGFTSAMDSILLTAAVDPWTWP